MYCSSINSRTVVSCSIYIGYMPSIAIQGTPLDYTVVRKVQ